MLLGVALLGVLPSCGQGHIDDRQLLKDVEELSSDAYQGREAGTEGAARARQYLASAFGQRGLQPLGSSFEHPFTLKGQDGQERGMGGNVIGYIEGTVHPTTYLVVTAHYDHLGTRGGDVYNGADDNASGTAALLALGAFFQAYPPTHSIVFVALDGEEVGLQGAEAFLASPPVEQDRILLNINMDMISRSEKGELYVAGTSHYPYLKPYLEQAVEGAELHLRFGHDTTDGSEEDWTYSSDHAVFHREGIPFLYFGVEDHAGYHHPSDDFEAITPAFFKTTVDVILSTLKVLDENLQEIRAQTASEKP